MARGSGQVSTKGKQGSGLIKRVNEVGRSGI